MVSVERPAFWTPYFPCYKTSRILYSTNVQMESRDSALDMDSVFFYSHREQIFEPTTKGQSNVSMKTSTLKRNERKIVQMQQNWFVRSIEMKKSILTHPRDKRTLFHFVKRLMLNFVSTKWQICQTFFLFLGIQLAMFIKKPADILTLSSGGGGLVGSQVSWVVLTNTRAENQH